MFPVIRERHGDRQGMEETVGARGAEVVRCCVLE
jgi:hypothetical protein